MFHRTQSQERATFLKPRLAKVNGKWRCTDCRGWHVEAATAPDAWWAWRVKRILVDAQVDHLAKQLAARQAEHLNRLRFYPPTMLRFTQ